VSLAGLLVFAVGLAAVFDLAALVLVAILAADVTLDFAAFDFGVLDMLPFTAPNSSPPPSPGG
jgi:hypothetical protein